MNDEDPVPLLFWLAVGAGIWCGLIWLAWRALI